MIKCRNCSKELIKNVNITAKDYEANRLYCKSCEKERKRVYYQNNKLKINNKNQEYEKMVKQQVITEYGGKCSCCGEDCITFLTIDHINNNGAETRVLTNQGSGGKAYRWLIKNNFPKDNYQLLCYNCNCAKGFYGICPHRITSAMMTKKCNYCNCDIAIDSKVNYDNENYTCKKCISIYNKCSCKLCGVELIIDVTANKSCFKYKVSTCKKCTNLEGRDYKSAIIENYGKKCVCCENDTFEFLSIDHIHNNGAQERKDTLHGSGAKLYKWLIDNEFPKDNYQLMCFNCNCANGFFGKCPHKSDM